MSHLPLVCFAILAKQKAIMLPAWLEHVEQWDYPKERIMLYVRANNSTDNTNAILKEWLQDNMHKYHSVHIDFSDVPEQVQDFGVHEWNATRFKVLGKIRNDSVAYALKYNAKFYFVCDVDNFIKPHTLSKLVKYNLPVVSPMMHNADSATSYYSNYHHKATERGYYLDDPLYYSIWRGNIRGIIQCDVVHCTYLIRGDWFNYIDYVDDTDDYEYVVFSRNLRNHNIPQFLDNTELHGYLSMTENVKAIQKKMKELQ